MGSAQVEARSDTAGRLIVVSRRLVVAVFCVCMSAGSMVMSAHEGFMSVESRGMSEEGKGTPCYKHIKTAPAISGSRF